MKRPLLILACVFCLICTESFSQQVIKDINQLPGTLVASNTNFTPACFSCNDLVYFVASDSLGNELWKTDGTYEGTQRVIDLMPGAASGVSVNPMIICLNGFLYFREAASPGRYWKTDGTASGTTVVTNNSPSPSDIAVFNDKVYYTSSDGLWATSGETGAEELIKGFASDDLFMNFSEFTPGATISYFSLEWWDRTAVQRSELWKTDGTVAGTELVKTFPHDHILDDMVTNGDILFFVGVDADHGQELWISDGTEAGTKIVVDLKLGPDDSRLDLITIYDGKLIFSANFETWVSDGTLAGTARVIAGFNVSAARELDASLYLLGSQGSNILLAKTDGTTDQVIDQLTDTHGAATQFLAAVNSKLIVPFKRPEHGIEIGVSDGSLSGTTLLKDINEGVEGSSPRSWAELGNQIIFMADDGVHGFEVWATDGTPEGTRMVRDVKTGTESATIEGPQLINNKIYFIAGSGIPPRELWMSDGTGIGTQKLHDLIFPAVFGSTDDHLIYMDESKFWKLNEATSDRSIMWDFSGVHSAHARGLSMGIHAGENLYFTIRFGTGTADIWRANVVTNDVSQVENSDGTPGSGSFTLNGVGLGNELVFVASDNTHGQEVWITEGNGEKKKLLKDINPGSGNSSVCCLSTTENKVFFIADDGVHGRALWSTNGTPEGTMMVKDVSTDLQDSEANNITATLPNGNVVFSAFDNEVWISDGTEAGTKLLKDDISESNSVPQYFTTLGDKVYFSALINGAEALFETDGTATGTKAIAMIPEGESLTSPLNIARSGDVVYFYLNGKIWRTIDRPENLELAAEIQIFSNLYALGNYIAFVGEDPKMGRELLAIEVTAFDQSIAFPPIVAKTLGSAAFSLEVSASSGLPVTVSTENDKVSIDGLTVSLLKAGMATIRAEQGGNEYYHPAAGISEPFCINPPKPTITAERVGKDWLLTSSSAENNQWFKNGESINTSDAEILVSDHTTYGLRVSVEGCESEFAEISIVTNIEEYEQSVSIFPNPSSDIIRVQVPLTAMATQFRIMDMHGRIILERMSTNVEESFDLSGYQPGVYVIQMGSNAGRSYRMFVKK